ncbi:MAG: phospho-N-acetylmuramoyl-pentapeptide-transferase, partial [Lachnospiraceae bacterium]
MIFQFLDYEYIDIITFISLIAAFVVTCIVIQSCQGMLPRDQGRAFAINGKVSQGKPRGAGILFILVFSLFSLLFVPYSNEFLIYIILIISSMVSGYLDDSSKSPWGEYKKGIIDLVIALAAAVTFVNYNGTTINLMYSDAGFTIPVWLFIILAVILIWVSINVTNCTDGVDGLSGTLSLITLGTMYGICRIKGIDSSFMHLILLFSVCVLAYLWFNASPSKLLMGDAGSRAMGIFIA